MGGRLSADVEVERHWKNLGSGIPGKTLTGIGPIPSGAGMIAKTFSKTGQAELNERETGRDILKAVGVMIWIINTPGQKRLEQSTKIVTPNKEGPNLKWKKLVASLVIDNPKAHALDCLLVAVSWP
ncbi:unnamed protein product [Calypogeia fissa]